VKELKNWKPTAFLGLNTLFVALCRNPGFASTDFSKFRITSSGGMALTHDAADQWKNITGCTITEGYGLTETSPMVTINPPGAQQIGTIGPPLPHTKVQIIDGSGNDLGAGKDGELCVWGPQVMTRYWQKEEETASSFTDDGYFKTGDIASIDDEGFVYILDRKKEIIVTAGGKNIAPQPVENELKLDKYISQAFVFGDRKPYLVALLTPNIERLIDYARDEQLDYLDIAELTKNSRIQELYEKRIEELNGNLPSYNTIKHFALIPREFSIEGGELTPTLKLKRKEIYKKYKEIIDEMYLANGNGLVFKSKSTNGETK
jgi:long-chain acyl-CoA synthetase